MISSEDFIVFVSIFFLIFLITLWSMVFRSAVPLRKKQCQSLFCLTVGWVRALFIIRRFRSLYPFLYYNLRIRNQVVSKPAVNISESIQKFPYALYCTGPSNIFKAMRPHYSLQYPVCLILQSLIHIIMYSFSIIFQKR